MKRDYWGGQLEMIILSKLLNIEFIVIFNEGKQIQKIPEVPDPTITQRMYLHYVGKFAKRFTHYNLFLLNNNGLCSINRIKELSAILSIARAQTYPTEPAPNASWFHW